MQKLGTGDVTLGSFLWGDRLHFSMQYVANVGFTLALVFHAESDSTYK